MWRGEVFVLLMTDRWWRGKEQGKESPLPPPAHLPHLNHALDRQRADRLELAPEAADDALRHRVIKACCFFVSSVGVG